MKLLKFRVLNFRSIVDSTWIDCDDVTNIIGVNEAGKSNALIALWKLNPARDGKINFLEDLPRARYSELKDQCGDMPFIQACFQIDENEELFQSLLRESGHGKDEIGQLCVERCYNGKYVYEFPDEKDYTNLPSEKLTRFIDDKIREIKNISPSLKNERKYKDAVVKALDSALDQLHDNTVLTTDTVDELKVTCSIKVPSSAQSKIAPIVAQIVSELEELLHALNRPPIINDNVAKLIQENIPSFVYYSNYGNLDSEIYLPHVIENLSRSDITGVAAAKARTLRVLFEYIDLKPQEILEMGSEGQNLNKDQD